MKQYYRQRYSTYSNYRYSSPNSASFIAPEGKIANFMLDFLDGVPGIDGLYDQVGGSVGGGMDIAEQMQDMQMNGAQPLGPSRFDIASQIRRMVQQGKDPLALAPGSPEDLASPGMAQAAEGAAPGFFDRMRGAARGAREYARQGLDNAGVQAQVYANDLKAMGRAAAGNSQQFLNNAMAQGRDALQGAQNYAGAAQDFAGDQMQALQANPNVQAGLKHINEAGQFIGDHKGAVSAGAAAATAGGGGILGWLGMNKRNAQAAAAQAAQAAQAGGQAVDPGMLERLKRMPMGGKVAAGAAGLAGLAGAGIMANRAMQGSPEEAAYRAYYNAVNFNRYYR